MPIDASPDRWSWRTIVFWAAIFGGAFVRFYALGQIPAGLNADEASTGVEALSILRTGMDRWGNHLPVYFPAWGSGMNALYSYLAVPVIGLFGLKVTALRSISAVFGVLTLPVTYFATRIHFSRDTALATLVLVAFLPWNVFNSRWALESSLAPFWFTLGILTLGKALQTKGIWPVVAFIPWAVGLYAYATEMIPAALSGIAILYAFRKQVFTDLPRWGLGLLLAVALALPFLLFLAKNQLHIGHLPFESGLPISFPTLAASRFSQIHQSLVLTVFDNLTFIIGGYRDGLVYHQSVFFLPLTAAAPYLTLLGVFALSRSFIGNRQPNLVLIVVATAVVPICLIPLNQARLNWFYIPSLMIAAWFVIEVGKHFRAALHAAILYFCLFAALFYPYYFMRFNDELPALDANLGNGFRIGLEDSLRAEVALAKPGESIFVDIGKVHPYLYVLFYGLADIESFQKTRELRVEDGVYRVAHFDRFFFERDALPQNTSYVFVAPAGHSPCAAPDVKTAANGWLVGRCAEEN